MPFWLSKKPKKKEETKTQDDRLVVGGQLNRKVKDETKKREEWRRHTFEPALGGLAENQKKSDDCKICSSRNISSP